jgi:broad specificity phosphatase PhoE
VTRLVLVRHGQAGGQWSTELDPGLSLLGRVQAEKAAAVLSTEGSPVSLITSPSRRARETAAPLEQAWDAVARVDRDVGEIVCPPMDLSGRGPWLDQVMSSPWERLDADLRRWRQRVVDGLCRLEADAVVFTHFIAINVAVGVAIADDRVVCFSPDNASRTVLDLSDGALRLVSLGSEAQTEVRT